MVWGVRQAWGLEVNDLLPDGGVMLGSDSAMEPRSPPRTLGSGARAPGQLKEDLEPIDMMGSKGMASMALG